MKEAKNQVELAAMTRLAARRLAEMRSEWATRLESAFTPLDSDHERRSRMGVEIARDIVRLGKAWFKDIEESASECFSSDEDEDDNEDDDIYGLRRMHSI